MDLFIWGEPPHPNEVHFSLNIFPAALHCSHEALYILSEGGELFTMKNSSTDLSQIPTSEKIQQLSAFGSTVAYITYANSLYISRNSLSSVSEISLQSFKALKVSCGASHISFIASKGFSSVLFTLGSNEYGQLCTKISSMTPVEIPMEETPIDVACGLYHTGVLTANSQLFTAGRNDHGQLGIGTFENTDMLKLVHLRNVSKVFFGGHSACLANQQLFIWGNGNPLPLCQALVLNPANITMGESGGACIDENGDLWVWGIKISKLYLDSVADKPTKLYSAHAFTQIAFAGTFLASIGFLKGKACKVYDRREYYHVLLTPSRQKFDCNFNSDKNYHPKRSYSTILPVRTKLYSSYGVANRSFYGNFAPNSPSKYTRKRISFQVEDRLSPKRKKNLSRPSSQTIYSKNMMKNYTCSRNPTNRSSKQFDIKNRNPLRRYSHDLQLKERSPSNYFNSLPNKSKVQTNKDHFAGYNSKLIRPNSREKYSESLPPFQVPNGTKPPPSIFDKYQQRSRQKDLIFNPRHMISEHTSSIKILNQPRNQLDLEFIRKHLRKQNEKIEHIIDHVNDLKQTDKDLSNKASMLKPKCVAVKKLASDLMDIQDIPAPVDMSKIRQKSRSMKHLLAALEN